MCIVSYCISISVSVVPRISLVDIDISCVSYLNPNAEYAE